jgi:hypothetical protein
MALSASQEVGMAEIGRPRADVSRARREHFLRLVLDGVSCEEAAKLARVKPERALAILTPLVRPLLAKAA